MLMCADTVAVLGPNAMLCENRSLLWDRLFDPLAKPAIKKSIMEKALSLPTVYKKQKALQEFIIFQLLFQNSTILFGKLQSRLLINLSAGLGSGVCLDRLSGYPTIPGSAIKGCARRSAIEELLSASSVESRAVICRDIALVFGWNKKDWITRKAFPESPSGDNLWKKQRSDLAWACGDSWEAVAKKTTELLAETLNDNTELNSRAIDSNSNGFEGLAHFLPAIPWDMHSKDTELEIFCSHHPQYNSEPSEPDRHQFPSDWNRWKREWEEWHRNFGGAPDTEDPKISYVPAVAEGQVFAFVIQGEPRMSARGKTWLQQGLVQHGIGSRTQSGYGIFETGDVLQQNYLGKIQQIHDSENQLRIKEREQQLQQEQDEIRRMEMQKEEQALSRMNEEEKLEYQLSQLHPEQFWGKVQRFRDLDKHAQKRMIRVLQTQRAAIWTELKARARRGGQWAQVEQSIRETAKIRNLGKMP